MGTVTVTVQIGDPQGQRFPPSRNGGRHRLDPHRHPARVSSKSSESELTAGDPPDWPTGGIQPVEEGETRIRIAGMEFTTMVIFAEENEPSLLGVITLDPLKRLIPTWEKNM